MNKVLQMGTTNNLKLLKVELKNNTDSEGTPNVNLNIFKKKKISF